MIMKHYIGPFDWAIVKTENYIVRFSQNFNILSIL